MLFNFLSIFDSPTSMAVAWSHRHGRFSCGCGLCFYFIFLFEFELFSLMRRYVSLGPAALVAGGAVSTLDGVFALGSPLPNPPFFFGRTLFFLDGVTFYVYFFFPSLLCLTNKDYRDIRV